MSILITFLPQMKLLFGQKISACGTAGLCRREWPGGFKNAKALKLKCWESCKLQYNAVFAVP
jgi:hypothetical protein